MSSLFNSFGCALSWYVRDFMIVRTRCLTSNLFVGEVLRQRVEQFVVARRVRVAEVVHRIDDALAHQVEPDAVDDRLGEERVAPAPSASRPAPRGGPRPASRRRRRRRGTRGAITLPVRGCVTSPSRSPKTTSAAGAGRRPAPARPASVFCLHPREPRGHAVVVVLRPALERVVVALRALHADAEEELRRRLGEALRVLRDAVVVRRRVGERAAAGGDQLAHDLVERRVLLDVVRGATPGRRACPSPGSSCGSTASTSAHFSAQKSAYSGRVQQRVDELVALLRVLVGEERLRLVGGRQAAEQSRYARRTNSSSVHRSDGGMRHLLELGEDVLIDVVRLRRVRPGEALARLEVREPHRRPALRGSGTGSRPRRAA